MGLKDIPKIVANQIAREKHEEATSGLATPKESPNVDLKPGTSRPANVTGHLGFKYDSANPFHKDMIKTLLNNGHMDKIVVHDSGAVSIPKDLAYDERYSAKFQTAAETSGGEKRFQGEAAKVKPRKSETKSAPSVRPTPPKISKPTADKKAVAPANTANNIKEEMRNIFSGANVRTDPEIAAKRAAEKAAAEAAEKKARAAERKRRLRGD